MNILTPKVKAAFIEISKEHPDVSTVVFFVNGQWLYFDDENESPKFSQNIDVNILEDAQSEVEEYCGLPAVFHWNNFSVG